jgi:hypothetical protein
MRKVQSIRHGIEVRLAGLAFLLVITTGQASSEGCMAPPEEKDSGVVVADGAAQLPAPALDLDATVTSPAPQAAPEQASVGSRLPAGEYQCLDTYVEVGADMRISYKEVLLIEDENTYRYRKNGPAGEYSFTPANGEIRWISGPYAGGNPTGRFERKPNGRDLITLTYTFYKLGSDDDFCFRKAGAQ